MSAYIFVSCHYCTCVMRICMLHISYICSIHTQRQDVGTKKYPAPARHPKDDSKQKKKSGSRRVYRIRSL